MGATLAKAQRPAPAGRTAPLGSPAGGDATTESMGRDSDGIVHDFNNALFAINGYAELLSEDLAPERLAYLDADEALRSVQAIIDATARASSLTAELLTLDPRQGVASKMSEDAPATAPEPLPIGRTQASGHHEGDRG